jgi:hypothetical protein
MRAPEALKLHGIEKVVMGPKEGLGLVNGTAVSGTSSAALVVSSLLTQDVAPSFDGHDGSLRHPLPCPLVASCYRDDGRSDGRTCWLFPPVSLASSPRCLLQLTFNRPQLYPRRHAPTPRSDTSCS